ncbi:MAG: DUF2959 family protein [Candidatus Zhuqueibacterota bacterium]
MNNKSSKFALTIFGIMILLMIIIGNGDRIESTSSMADVRTTFKKVIDNYDWQRSNMEQVFEEGKNSLMNFKEAIRVARDKYAEFGKVYDRWEYVEKEIDKLRVRYDELVKGADEFYSEIETTANSITDPELRSASLRRMQKHRNKYYLRLRDTESKISVLNVGVVKVTDTVKALEINYTLNVVDETIYQTFQEIDTMITEVMPELEKLTAESKELLSTL